MNRILSVCKRIVMEALRYLLWLLRYRGSSKEEPGSNRGEKVIITGNGPSAKEFPFAKFQEQGYGICCVNFFALDEERFFSVKPRFYCCVDPVYADPEFQKTEKCQKLISILERVDWDLNFICYKDEHLPLNNNHIKFRYVNHNVLFGPLTKGKNRLYSRNMASCGFQNVMIAAVYYFIMSEADHILLTGVENNWHLELFVGEDNDVYRRDTHFYGTEVINLTQTGEIGKGQLYLYFDWYSLTLKQYESLAHMAKANNILVENTCLDSFVDAFPKTRI